MASSHAAHDSISYSCTRGLFVPAHEMRFNGTTSHQVSGAPGQKLAPTHIPVDKHKIDLLYLVTRRFHRSSSFQLFTQSEHRDLGPTMIARQFWNPTYVAAALTRRRDRRRRYRFRRPPFPCWCVLRPVGRAQARERSVSTMELYHSGLRRRYRGAFEVALAAAVAIAVT